MKTENNKVYYAGKYRGIIKYKEKEYTVSLIVEDKEAPIIEGVKDITINKGDNIDLLKDIKVSDNSHDTLNISTSVKGVYNVNKPGIYNLTVEASDSSNNISTKEFKLTVKDVKPVTIPNDGIVGKTSKGYDILKKNDIYYIKGILVANKSYNLPSNYAPGRLLSEFDIAFTKMKNDAKKEGLNIYVVSGYRSYARQTTLYNNYVARDGKKAADTYSARPGYSEHQTGLGADLNLVDTSFENTKEGKWLANNCYKYGFILRYPKGKEAETGYIYEPWHFRYIGDEAKNLYNNGNWISLEEYLGIDSKY